jgi:hypothetical protein
VHPKRVLLHDPLKIFNCRVIVTPAVYPRLVEFLHFDLERLWLAGVLKL